MAETEHDAYLELRRQCDHLIAELAKAQDGIAEGGEALDEAIVHARDAIGENADLRRQHAEAEVERDKAQAACAKVADQLDCWVHCNQCDPGNECWADCSELAARWGREAIDILRSNDHSGQPLLAELKQLRALRQAVLAFQAVERSWVRGNDVPWGEAVDKALDVMYSAALAAKEAKP